MIDTFDFILGYESFRQSTKVLGEKDLLITETIASPADWDGAEATVYFRPI